MKKFILILLALLMIVVCFTGCKTKAPEAKNKISSDTNIVVSLEENPETVEVEEITVEVTDTPYAKN